MALAEPRFSELRGEPLSAVVTREVREAIVEGHLSPGEAINEARLSRELRVSRAPIREALRSLEREGLVSNVPYRGAIVTPLTVRGVEELQALRRLLETFAAEQALTHASDAEMSSLHEITAEMQACAEQGDLHCMNDADVRFHTRIVELSGNELLTNVWDTYVPRLRRLLTFRNRVNTDLLSIVALHEELTVALRERDLERVKRCYALHGADIVVALRHLFDAEPAAKQE